MSLFTGIKSVISPQTIETATSNYNGRIMVDYYCFRYRIIVGGFWQSGQYAKATIRRALNGFTRTDIKSILLLGVGGGSMAQFLHERFPQAQITGVEIDPMMIELAKKYFGLGNWRYLNVIIADAADYIRRYYGKDAFDMVVSDVFVGCDRPESLDSHDHIRGIFRVLNPGGIYITNCSYLPAYRKASDRYLSRVRSVFSGVEIIKSYPNFLVRAYK